MREIDLFDCLTLYQRIEGRLLEAGFFMFGLALNQRHKHEMAQLPVDTRKFTCMFQYLKTQNFYYRALQDNQELYKMFSRENFMHVC